MDQSIIRMANDIATNVRAWGETEAVEMISEHINKFWSPPMRKRIFELFNETPDQFNEQVVKALPKVRCNEYNPVNVEFKEKHGTGG